VEAAVEEILDQVLMQKVVAVVPLLYIQPIQQFQRHKDKIKSQLQLNHIQSLLVAVVLETLAMIMVLIEDPEEILVLPSM
tara:strand:- start:628 stop:867 length:240 start_codon:yes stop_codon:yes gene_type:complete